MIVFLRRIPANTSTHEITSFIQPAIKGGLLARSGRIDNIKIVRIKDAERNTLEYHGLVRIEPDAAAARAIKTLNRKAINGKNIAVREYHTRNWHNDPRLKNQGNLKFADRRKGERRRRKLELGAADALLFG